jgi:thymidylate synthase ThyX
MMSLIKTFYFSIFMNQFKKGTNYKRANEQARSMLTNNMSTLIVYTRNRWQWEHFIKLRVDSHTQVEARREAIPLLETFQKLGWLVDYKIDREKFVAKKS